MFNCIGYFNYRYFFNFLWFVTTALIYGSAICFPAFMKMGGTEYRDQVRASGGFQRPLKDMVVRHLRSNPFVPTPNERTPVALGFMLCLCLGLAVMCLGSFHLYLVVSAQTTIEFHGNLAKRKKKGWKNPYSAGSWKENWEMIYGTRYWTLHSADGNSLNGGEQYRYRGCLGVLRAMMPSNREPEFLPFIYQGKMVRRRARDASHAVPDDTNADDEIDLEKAFRKRPAAVEETEIFIEPKESNGGLVGRARSNKAEERV